MIAAPDYNLILALLIVVAALALFGWHLVSTTKRVGLAISEGRVPRRYLVLGFVAALGAIYFIRR